MKSKISTERCYLCSALTGKMGEDNDSIYVILFRDDDSQSNGFFNKKNKLGPLCKDCYDCLVYCNFVDPKEGHYPGQRPVY